jgi:phage replication-related protein YjqB (UPF0714/DUF867 family)
MADRYSSFAELAASEQIDVDYRIRIEDRGTSIIVIAPHGGHIEPGTSQIAAAIANAELSLYAFEGVRPGRPHGDLHITSTNFDEPNALNLVRRTQTAIAIHGRRDKEGPSVWVGGLATFLRDKLVSALNSAGFDATIAKGHLAARDARDICNRGMSGAGVQFELARTLRGQLTADTHMMRAFCNAIRVEILG